MGIQKVGVIGAGTMGNGIAQVFAMSGASVVLIDQDASILESALARIEKSIRKIAAKKGNDEDAAAASARELIQSSTDLDSLADCDLVVEAIVENLDVKRALFAELGGLCKAETIFASNTSSFPISEMAAASGRAERMVGLHFFNPVQLMRLVEVVRTDKTDEDVFAAARAFGEACGKAPVACKDTPGFVVNRLLVPYMVQAMQMLDRGDASKEDIDTAMQFGCGHPMGPITLTDYVGLDTTLFILQGWVKRFPNEPAFAVPKILEEKVAAGKLGRKTGEGFYKWDGDKKS